MQPWSAQSARSSPRAPLSPRPVSRRRARCTTARPPARAPREPGPARRLWDRTVSGRSVACRGGTLLFFRHRLTTPRASYCPSQPRTRTPSTRGTHITRQQFSEYTDPIPSSCSKCKTKITQGHTFCQSCAYRNDCKETPLVSINSDWTNLRLAACAMCGKPNKKSKASAPVISGQKFTLK